MDEIKDAQVIQRQLKKVASIDSLPQAYLDFLKYNQKGLVYLFKGEKFRVASPSTLLKRISINRQDVQYWNQLGIHAKSLQEFSGKTHTYTTDNKEYPISRLSAGFSFGESDDGDLAYLDKGDNYSVWFYRHDGGYVEKQADNFFTWLSFTRRTTAAVDRMHPSQKEAYALGSHITTAISFYIEYVLIPRRYLKESDFLASVQGHVNISRKEFDTIKEFSEIVVGFLHARDKLTRDEKRELIKTFVEVRQREGGLMG